MCTSTVHYLTGEKTSVWEPHDDKQVKTRFICQRVDGCKRHDILAGADESNQHILERTAAIVLDHLRQALAVRVKEVLLNLHHIHLGTPHNDAHKGITICAETLRIRRSR